MARGSQPRRRPATVVTHISSLPDDILREIFLRLPSLATLVRAALTCRAWRRAVASSPAFRSRFRALHRAPLLGHGGLPIFAAAHRRADPDVLAALRGGDFLLTSLMDGTLCIVRVTARGIYVWLPDDDSGGGNKWIRKNVLKYTDEMAALLHIVNFDTPNVVAVRDGFVYLVTYGGFVSFCLETWKLEKLLFPRYFGDYYYPYFVAWPLEELGLKEEVMVV
ncbi:hypothetical protein HU200_050129 [Digitaria exilis]|uniref:F-box domain-containing protein n=1 Tax=Digitaria exilis TaxID=1010633 RepID=A0A835EB91_9POAL|nr:hypothetical protein HU200_050129 [Digitaria exilis]